jgi:transposase
MYLRRINKRACGKDHHYWALVESRRTAQGPRQHIVCYLGDADVQEAMALQHAVERVDSYQQDFFQREELPSLLEINARKIRTERVRDFGGIWLGLKLYDMLGFDEYFGARICKGRELVEWQHVLKILVISRLIDPSSELHLAEQTFEDTAFEDLLGVPARYINDDRLYRALDVILPHKEGIEVHLKQRLGELFNIEYDLYLYDVTSTYFEGTQSGGSLAQYGYSRDKRSDCKQVCIGLVVTREGLPLGYEVFAGNTHDGATVEEIIEKMETRYGKARCVWVMDRGMISAENMEFLGDEHRRYIIGTPKSNLRKFEQHFVDKQWHEIREGLEVKQCPSPDSEKEVFILCRSRDRALKEQAMHERFSKRIEDGIARMQALCERRHGKDISHTLERRIGRLLEKNSRAASLFDIETDYDADRAQTVVRFKKREQYAEWESLSEGCYMLRTNIADWTPQQLWEAYIHLTHAEDAFRIHKSDLKIRPIWHRKEQRVLAHILISFLSFVMWKTLAQLCKSKGLGTEPRKVLEEIKQVKLVDVVLATPQGKEYRIRTIARPEKPTQVLLHKLGIRLPEALRKREM